MAALARRGDRRQNFQVPLASTQTEDATARRFLLRSVATSRFSATRVDTNADRVTTFLAAHPGQFYCNACLGIEAVSGLSKIYVNQLTRALRDVKPYRRGKVVCVRCGEVHECIAYGSSDLARHGHTRVDHLSLPEARRLGSVGVRSTRTRIVGDMRRHGGRAGRGHPVWSAGPDLRSSRVRSAPSSTTIWCVMTRTRDSHGVRSRTDSKSETRPRSAVGWTASARRASSDVCCQQSRGGTARRSGTERFPDRRGERSNSVRLVRSGFPTLLTEPARQVPRQQSRTAPTQIPTQVVPGSHVSCPGRWGHPMSGTP